ncbi:hypothetical protein AWC38_SpisGene11593 [Stylophora pistillata]|uniref:Uncharacterized protein n=1 Tax=Stylophora pistillata TaxID=50429 RepID=A0A2B4S5N0_STYPI|nr:hypothetical protein AWC38_SpisGene11593 [Stylophora pistillata]
MVKLHGRSSDTYDSGIDSSNDGGPLLVNNREDYDVQLYYPMEHEMEEVQSLEHMLFGNYLTNSSSAVTPNFIPNGVAHSVVEKEEANSNAVPESRHSRVESEEANSNAEPESFHSRVESEEANSNAESENSAEHPGIVKVRVYSQSKTFLGEMDFHYIDLMNRVAFKAVQHGIEGVTKLYGLMGKHSIDWWKQSASVKQNSALSGQATDALNDGCEEKPSAEDPLFAYGYEDLMQFFDMMKCLSEESCSQHLANTEKWIQLSRVVCKIYGQLGHGQNLLHGHVALCGESEENYFADAENSSCEPSHFDIVSLSDSKDCGGSINGDGGTHGDELELYSDPRCNTSFVDSTPISHLDVTGQGSECKSLLLVEEVEKKEVGQDPRPTNISACEKVESWLQSVCSANGLPFLSPGGPESLDTVHNDTLTLLNSVESARAMIEGRE